MAEVLPLLLRRRIKRKIKDAGAISVETAKTAEELGLDRFALRWLEFVKDVKKTSDGRYYLLKDEKR